MAFAPENELEAALVAAATNPDARPRFYEVLSRSDLVVIDEDPPRKVDIDGVPHAAVFSSAARIGADVTRGATVRHRAVNARTLFGAIGAQPVILNPGSAFGKTFTSEEVAQVVDGSIFAPRETLVVPDDREVMLGQPANYPAHVTDPIAAFFETKSEVRAAYLAHMFDPESGDEAHTLIGVDIEDGTNFERLMGEAAIIIGAVAQKEEVVDFCRIIAGEGVSEYMTKETKPFYRRKVLGLF